MREYNTLWSFNRVGNAPRVDEDWHLFRNSTRGVLPTPLNELELAMKQPGCSVATGLLITQIDLS